MKQTKILLLSFAIFFTACQNVPKATNVEKTNTDSLDKQQAANKMTDIPFVVAKNYFVKNTVTAIENPKIETAEKFAEIFGMATTMSKDGKPTPIDFTQQNVLTVILPKTDMSTTITPISLQKNEKGDIVLSYKIIVGEKQTYFIKPNFIIIVDKAEKGNVVLKEIK